ncbi:MraY family glycosyltransferase [Thioflexithrix psekupsensis]|uniref:Glycosyl transferase n=1 Tax=Thioflexithrix psekupsensis TaxID=1570016 RepID=A0A251XBJ6_9GAMM|nr:glycosyltransferase family 4 protein [Thioflexithrix psekupsensis]OUD15704.1 hypothetical protein TPSD3_04105 [Thioflexithrix psekupsensis]
MIPTLMLMTFALSALLTYRFSRPEGGNFLLDHPNARSLHSRPTPMSGGIAMLTAFGCAAILACVSDGTMQASLWICLSTLLIFTISLLDDFFNLSALFRLMIHAAAAVLLLSQTEWWLIAFSLPYFSFILPETIAIIISLLFVVWMTNLYNFMDGMDGIAGSMALFGFSTMAILAGLAGEMAFMLMSVLVACAATGFLVFNFPPAKIFMGDTGSSSLGFLAAAFSLWGTELGIFPLWVALLIFSPFIIDATVTLLKRMWRKEKIWQAHKTHYYQRLVQLYGSHRPVLLRFYALMAACSFSALFAPFLSAMGQLFLLLFWVFIYVGLIIWVDRVAK